MDRIIKSKTNDGFPAKQYCILKEDKSINYEMALIIKRLVLSDSFDSYLMTGHVMLKRFKKTALFGKTFSIKVSTLYEIMGWIKNETSSKPVKINDLK